MKIQIILIHEQDKESKMYFLRMIARLKKMSWFKTITRITETIKISVNYNVESYPLTIDRITTKICLHYRKTRAQIMKADRHREICQIRQLCMYFAKQKTNLSLQEIGTYYGGRDHATVLHAENVIENLINTDSLFRKQFAEIEKIFK